MGWLSKATGFVGSAIKKGTKYTPTGMVLGKYDPGNFLAGSFDDSLNNTSEPRNLANTNDYRAQVLASLTTKKASVASLIKNSNEIDDAEKQYQLKQLDAEFASQFSGAAAKSTSDLAGTAKELGKLDESLTSYQASLTKMFNAEKKQNDVARLVTDEQFKALKNNTNSRLQSNQLNAFLGSVDAKQLAARMGVKT